LRPALLGRLGGVDLKRKLNLTNIQKCKNCSRVCVSLRTTAIHNTVQSSSDYLPSYPPGKHQSSDAVYRRGGENLWDK